MIKRILENDIFGIGASILCIVHCAAMPILVSAFPLLFPHHGHGSVLELIFIFFIVIAFFAFVKGYSIHKSKQAMILAFIGLPLLIGSLWVDDDSKIIVSTVGGCFILAAHFWNYRLCKCTAHHH